VTREADLIFTGGKIITSVGESEPFDALAVKNGRILAVGTTAQLGELPAQRRVQLDGKSLIPGLIDAHNHLSWYSQLLRYVDCRVPLNGDISTLLERMRQRAGEIPRGEWVRGWGFADYKVRGHRFPSLAEMDEAVPHTPAIIVHASGHSAVVNSQALTMMDIHDHTPDPPGGKIERDPHTGKPNGVLHETAMVQFSLESVFIEFLALPPEQQISVLERGSAEFARLGITTACDAAVMPPLLAVYNATAQAGRLKCRVLGMPFYEWSKPILEKGRPDDYDTEYFKLGPVKLLGDGSLSGRTAAVSQPYQGTHDTGILYRDQAALDQIVRQLDELDLQIAIHAIGDRAVEQVLLAYKKVIGKGKPNLKRHRMEHAGIVNPDLLQLMADIDLVIATQPRMLYEQGDGFYRSCGAERIHWVYPYKTYIEQGLHVAGSSDCPVVSQDPLLGMRDGILRQTEEGRILAPEQRLSFEQVLHMFTVEAAYSLFEENEKGTLEEGKLADLVVLSGDPKDIPAEQWADRLQVEMTVVGGEVVYESDRPHLM
jgi:predicted amidohydrolase YtcJ